MAYLEMSRFDLTHGESCERKKLSRSPKGTQTFDPVVNTARFLAVHFGYFQDII